MQLQAPLGWLEWDDGREQRLSISMLFATLFIATALSLLRLPIIPDFAPIVELLVQIVRDPSAEELPQERQPAPSPHVEPVEVRPESTPVEQVVTPIVQRPGSADVERVDSVEVAPPADVVPVVAETQIVDLETASAEAIKEFLDGLENPLSVNPLLDAKRREFAGRYQPPTHSGPKPIWENVEKDQLGRTVLRSGDCSKVIDDPNVGSQYKFQQFDQYIVTCTYQKRQARELPWVAEIRERYHYLKYPDGIVPDDSYESAESDTPGE
ncbi:MAG: hypothetical protein OER97_09835 [Gammaproteobacteria bacterium]|nr:hypothetical protein [Gammaproteobacteria bacterium]